MRRLRTTAKNKRYWARRDPGDLAEVLKVFDDHESRLRGRRTQQQPRQRIGLTMRLDDTPGESRGSREARPSPRDARTAQRHEPRNAPPPANNAFAAAFAKARKP